MPPESAVIRFNCVKCGRRYELADAMAHLPLVCKRCGEPLNVPGPTADPEPSPAWQGDVAPLADPPGTVFVPVTSTVPVPPSPAGSKEQSVIAPAVDDAASAAVRSTSVPDLHLEITGPHTSVPVGEPPAAVSNPLVKPTPEPGPSIGGAEPSRSRQLLPVAADVLVGLALLVIGVLFGEILARQSTGEVLRDAGSAVKFPPIDLLLWLSPPVLLGLVYGLLISRGKSLGGWLRRRFSPDKVGRMHN